MILEMCADEAHELSREGGGGDPRSSRAWTRRSTPKVKFQDRPYDPKHVPTGQGEHASRLDPIAGEWFLLSQRPIGGIIPR